MGVRDSHAGNRCVIVDNVIFVLVYPGLIELTRMPYCAHSTARDLPVTWQFLLADDFTLVVYSCDVRETSVIIQTCVEHRCIS